MLKFFWESFFFELETDSPFKNGKGIPEIATGNSNREGIFIKKMSVLWREFGKGMHWLKPVAQQSENSES